MENDANSTHSSEDLRRKIEELQNVSELNNVNLSELKKVWYIMNLTNKWITKSKLDIRRL